MKKSFLLILSTILVVSCGKNDGNSPMRMSSKAESIERSGDSNATEVETPKIETKITLSGEEKKFIEKASVALTEQLRKNIDI